MPGAIPTKDPVKVMAGLQGARRRWGEPRVLRLTDLDPRIREAVLALVRADEAARQAAEGGQT